MNLNYTIFDFGARAGRINAAKAEALAANLAFNDTHRNVIYRVEETYYQLLDASGQEEAARANLSNAQAVQQAAEERLNHGLATLPDVLEARSATAQAEFELQAVLGAEEIAYGNLATALGTTPQTAIHVQPLRELTIPSTIDDSVSFAMDPPPAFIVRDAFTNVKHLQFALKGCLAASLCYIIYNGVDWPGISTAVTTCFLTALSTVGSSRQKQVLRISGAVVGGFLIGMGSQIFILPHLDSIAGFTILFVVVTAFASWFMTSSPRLSYFGVQIAVAFCLIHLNSFAIEPSLSIARDRVVGILFGLIMMWFVFDQLWGASAVSDMKRAFLSAVRSLAQFAREPISKDYDVAAERSYSLREAINNNFDNVRASADGVLFEFGPSRQQDLAWRTSFRQWQPELRLIFITEIALWKYRAGLPGFELPHAVGAAQRAFDDELALALEAIADRIEGRPSQVGLSEESLAHLERAVSAYEGSEPQPATPDRFQAFLTLHRRIESLTSSLQKEIGSAM